MYSLRDYQEDLISLVLASWEKGNHRILLQLPTGAGKTIIFAAIIDEFVRQNKRVMVVAHRKELITQACEKIKNTTRIFPGIIQSGFERNLNCAIQVASIQTLIRSENKLKIDLLIFDEAHHTLSQSYARIIAQYPHAHLLGVTATPTRMDGQGFKDIYDELITGPSVAKLIAQGYLSDFKMFGAVAKIKTKGIKITAGDFNLKQLKQAVALADITGDLVPTWKKYAYGKKTILFAVDVAHSKECAKAFSNAGISAEHLDGETPAIERDAILERFRSGKTQVLCNCNIVTEGFDVPTIEAIQCVRPTLSLVLHIQMFGRALRPAFGKEHAILIDHTNNWGVHGLPDKEQEWNLEPKPSRSSFFSQKCPKCGHIFQPSSCEIKETIGYSLYEDTPLSTHCTICPYCHTKFKFYLGMCKESPPRQFTLDILEEYGQIVEIIPENKSVKDILTEQSKLTESIKARASGMVSHNYIVCDGTLDIKSKVYVYGRGVEMYHSTLAGDIQNCYTGTAIIELVFNSSTFKLAVADITHNILVPNRKALALLSIIGINKYRQESLLKKIGKTFCFQLKLKERETKAAKKAAETEAREKKSAAYREEMRKQEEQEHLEKLAARRRKKEGKEKPQILMIKPKKEV